MSVITGDRDAFQLVSDHVTVLYPRKGVSDLARMTPAAVEEKYGLTPRQYPDFAALRGDPSDNLPGIPGVGEKTATKWIREYGSFDELVARADEVRGKVGDSLRANLAQVITNRQLTELVKDVPLDRAPDDLARVDWDRERCTRCSMLWSSVSCVTGLPRPCRTLRSRSTLLPNSRRCRPSAADVWSDGSSDHGDGRVGVSVNGHLGVRHR